MTEARSWSVEVDVREDAERLFVPAADLVGAGVGDDVELVSSRPAGRHHARIIEQVDDEVRGRYFIVELV